MWRSGDTAGESGTPSHFNCTESSQTRVSGFVGQLNLYVTGEPFEDYLEHANNFYSLNRDKADEELVRLLINCMGTEGTEVIKAFKLREENFAKKPFEVVIAMCKKLFIDKRNIHAERYEFNSRKQKKREKLQDLAIEIMAEDCAFGEFQDQAMRDQFIAGLSDASIRKKFFTLDSTLSFKEVVDIASRNKRGLQPPSTSSVKVPLKARAVKRIKCMCGLLPKYITSKSKDNKGRRLCKCAENKCKFRKWADELDSASPSAGPSFHSDGKPAAKPKCRNCKQEGHNRLKCPNANEQQVKQPTVHITNYINTNPKN